MIPPADRALHAARNNADLYRAMFDAHDLAWQRDAALFRAMAPPLRCYSAALVLQPGDPAKVVPAIAAALAPFAGGAAVKDGFATLDLHPLGLEVGFGAQWIWADQPASGKAGWQVIDSCDDLERWEQGWKAGGSPTATRMFPPECLTSGNLVFCGRRSEAGAGFDRGGIINLSGDIVGLSNVFRPDDSTDLFVAALACAAMVGAGRPVVGFEHGAALDAAMAAGFEPAGPLTVWFPRSGG